LNRKKRAYADVYDAQAAGSEAEADLQVPAAEDPGIPIPAWWYYWPPDCDPVYQAEKRAWHEHALAGEEGPIPMPDPNRSIFLPENMPSELRGKGYEELSELGVKQIPGQEAMEGLIFFEEVGRGVQLDEAERQAFILEYLLPHNEAIRERLRQPDDPK
jgi:hypothetical protein